MAEVADKVEQEASAQLSAAEETSTSDKVDTAEKAETNREAATSKSEASETKGPDASEETKVDEVKDDESEKDEESKDEKKKDEMSEKKDSGKRKTSEGDRKDYKKPKVEQKRYNNNVKSDYSKLPETSDHDEIRKQVEFYFSDSNLYQDKHLMNEVGGSENKPVPVKHIHSFKRMQRFQPYSAVVAALKESEVLDIVGAAGVEEIQRKVALEPRGEKTEREYIQEFEDRTIPRSIYAKGFGDEEPSTQIDVEEFFEPYGPIRSIRLRRTYPDKVFKGSVFVEFEDEETQQQFLELDPKPKWQDKELLIKSKRQYCDEKKEDIAAGKIKPSGFKPFRDGGGYRGRGDRYHGDRRSGRGGKFDHRDKGRGRDRDEDDWKGRRTDFQRGDNDGFSRDGRGNGRGPRTCYNCGEEGHKKSDCPSLTKYDDKDTKASAERYDDEKEKSTKGDDLKSPESKTKRGREGVEGEAKDSKTEEAPAVESKKRAREVDDGDVDGGELKKAKSSEVEATA